MFIPIPHLTISMERARIGARTAPLRVMIPALCVTLWSALHYSLAWIRVCGFQPPVPTLVFNVQQRQVAHLSAATYPPPPRAISPAPSRAPAPAAPRPRHLEPPPSQAPTPAGL